MFEFNAIPKYFDNVKSEGIFLSFHLLDHFKSFIDSRDRIPKQNPNDILKKLVDWANRVILKFNVEESLKY